MKPNLIEMQMQRQREQSERYKTAPRKCPACAAMDLMAMERQGIEIDYCPTCRGVWLDRRELERLIDYANQSSTVIRIQTAPFPGPNGAGLPIWQPHKCFGQPVRKRSWLREIFD